MMANWARIHLQLGHRVASIGMLSIAAAFVVMLAANGGLGPYISASRTGYTSCLMVTFICSDIALLLGFIAWWINRSHGVGNRESLGLVAFSVVTMLVSIGLFAAARGPALDRFVQTKISPILSPEAARNFD